MFSSGRLTVAGLEKGEPRCLARAAVGAGEHGRDSHLQPAHTPGDRACLRAALRRKHALRTAVRQVHLCVVLLGLIGVRVAQDENEPAAAQLLAERRLDRPG